MNTKQQPVAADLTDERAAFEAWHGAKFGRTFNEWVDAKGRYAWDLTQELWNAWQARASLGSAPATPVPASEPMAWARPEDLINDGHGHSFSVLSNEPATGPKRVPLFLGAALDYKAAYEELAASTEHLFSVAAASMVEQAIAHQSAANPAIEPSEPAFYINPKIIDPATGKISNRLNCAITWSNKPTPKLWSLPVYLAAPTVPASAPATPAPIEPVKGPIWYMRDNHTFRPLHGGPEEMVSQCLEEFDAGYTCGMLCSKERGITVHAHGKGMREEFIHAALAALRVPPAALSGSLGDGGGKG